MKSNLIMIDGISGSGKDSRINELSEYAKKLGYATHLFTEPTHYREEILELKKNPNRDHRKELELFIKSRKKGLKEYQELLNKPNQLVFGNRGFISTEVYQNLQGIPLKEIREKNSFYPTPGLALILLCDPEIAVSRIHARNRKEGKPISLEETKEKITKLHKQYEKIASELDYAKIINTNGRPEAIRLVMKSHLNNHLEIPMQKAIFLDKDGTFVDNSKYPEVIPTDDIYEESYETLKKMQSLGYKLFVVSSQPWVARKRMTEEEVEEVFQSVQDKFAQRGVTITDYGYCIHDRRDNCPDKKPSTRLFEHLIEKYNINTTESYMVGDMDNDILAGKNIGLETIRVQSPFPNTTQPDHLIHTIQEIETIIKK